MRTLMTVMAVPLFVLLLCALLPGQSEDAIFEGIDDARALQVLKSVYGRPNRMNVPPQDGRFLYDLVIQKAYDRGLEIGTSNGYSAMWLGLAFRKNGGKLITIEINREVAEEAGANFRAAGLRDVIDLRVNDAFQEIPKLEGTFDFVFIDAWKDDYKRFFDLVYPRVTAGGAITAHNVLSQPGNMRDFLDLIKTHPKLETTIHRTSFAGISVSFKRGNSGDRLLDPEFRRKRQDLLTTNSGIE